MRSITCILLSLVCTIVKIIFTWINCFFFQYSLPLRVLFKSSPYFLLRYHTAELPLKLAPGMEMPFSLQFTPEQNIDYHHQITFVYGEEKYVIPIFGNQTNRKTASFIKVVIIGYSPNHLYNFCIVKLNNCIIKWCRNKWFAQPQILATLCKSEQ